MLPEMFFLVNTSTYKSDFFDKNFCRPFIPFFFSELAIFDTNIRTHVYGNFQLPATHFEERTGLESPFFFHNKPGFWR